MFDLAVVDLELPLVTGKQVCSQICSLFQTNEVVKISAVAQFLGNPNVKMFRDPFSVPKTNLLPVMIGCSSSKLTADLVTTSTKAGFSNTICYPIKPE